MALILAVVVTGRFLRRSRSGDSSCHCQSDYRRYHHQGRVFGIGWGRGRPIGISLKPSCLTINVGLAEAGQRGAVGQLSSWIEVGLERLRLRESRAYCLYIREVKPLGRDESITVASGSISQRVSSSSRLSS